MTKERSTFSSSTAIRVRKVSDEKPVPKSSTASWTPIDRSVGEHLVDDIQLAHHHRLGDLQDQPVRRHLVPAQRLGDLRG